jgi:hypothetical protein
MTTSLRERVTPILNQAGKSRWSDLAVIACVVVAIASVVSHSIVRLMGIRSTFSSYRVYGDERRQTRGILHGSSLAYGGIDWGQVSVHEGYVIESRATPGSSPSEWEIQDLRHSPGVTNTFIVLSVYDLNESILCDFRANLVPLTKTIGDLRASNADWPTWKRLLSQYGVMSIRTLFPTAGRADGVMTGIRDWARKALGRRDTGAGEGVKFGATGASTISERLSEWDKARLQRRLISMRSACLGVHRYDGVKSVALKRMAARAHARGEVTFIVVPVSATYYKEFVTPAVAASFETALTDFVKHSPETRIVRLDKLPGIENNDLFSDLVHLNMFGQKIATQALLAELSSHR